MMRGRLLNWCLLFGIVFCQKSKNSWNRETAEQRLDDIITVEFKARDANNDGLVTTQEIREFYTQHPEKMSKEGLEFIDKNFSNGAPVDLQSYRSLVKKWLAENGSVQKILFGVFGNNTQHLPTHNVWRPKTP